MDRGLNELLKWSIENANANPPPNNDPLAAPPTNRGLNPEALGALFGGPSDADLMKASMAVVTSRDAEQTLDDKLVAFDNFEQLIESLDNANLLAQLNLWTPLLGMLESDEAALRRMAAWCIGTAVQNNQRSQEHLFNVGGVAPLVQLAIKSEEPTAVRRKAVYALSSACRNYQPAMDALVATLRDHKHAAAPTNTDTPVDARNMDAVDAILNMIKAEVQTAEATAKLAAMSTPSE